MGAGRTTISSRLPSTVSTPTCCDDPLTQAFVAESIGVPVAEPRLRAPLSGVHPELHRHPVGVHGRRRTVTPVDVAGRHLQRDPEQHRHRSSTLGLPFDPTEYLSGEHSGLYLTPAAAGRQPQLRCGADPGRDPAHRLRRIARSGHRQVGSAITIPRHPTALYYNTETQAAAVDEYNWLYTSRANGGSGYCEDNPATATCVAPLDPATGFTSYIVPTDAAFDMSFILSNDPRPFYATSPTCRLNGVLYPLPERSSTPTGRGSRRPHRCSTSP